MLQRPSAHFINKTTGAMDGATGCYEKRIQDLRGIYADKVAFEETVAPDPERVVYRVHEMRPQQATGDLIFGTTWMEPGRIGAEFYITRGHIHARANRPETYYGESGQGLMLMESPEGETQIVEISPGVMVYVPPMWIHRSVNTGNEPLVMSFCYPSDSGQDYDIIARSGGMAQRIIASEDGWVAVNNVSYQPRTAEDIAKVYETTD
ncbi:MAG: glucose-6-phosphate isomerase [Roseibium sp.]